MNADHCGDRKQSNGTGTASGYVAAECRNSLVKVGQPHLTVLVMSVGWKWARNKVYFTALIFKSITVRTEKE